MLAAGVVAATSMIADYVVGVAPANRAGATSGLLETSSELGGALGIAVLGSVVNAVFRMDFPGSGRDGESSQTLAGAIAGAAHEPPGRSADIIDAARSGFVDGLTAAAWAGAAALVIAALVTIWGLRSPSLDGMRNSDIELTGSASNEA